MMDPAAELPQGVDPIPDSMCVDAQRLLCSPALADPVSNVLDNNNLLIEMRDPASIPQRFRACVDAKRLRCSATPADPVSKVFDGEITSSWPAPMPPLDDENLLQEILLCLPPKPSSLPRASLVCARWRNILSDPEFLKRFRKHHHNPPLLGFFTGLLGIKYNFVPVLDMKRDRIPPERFTSPKSSFNDYCNFCGCRHGLTVLLNELRDEVIVWDPLTGQQHCVAFPPGLRNIETFSVKHAAVMCADAEDGHVHGDCFSNPLKVVVICSGHTQTFACLYDSASGAWGNICSTVITDTVVWMRSSILIGNVLYWLYERGDILVFDIESQTLGVIEKPADTHCTEYLSFQLLRIDDDSGLGLAIMSKLCIQLWKRKSNCNGVIGWVLQQKTIQLDGLFPRGMRSIQKMARMVGYDEDSNVVVLATNIGHFMLELDLTRFRAISKGRNGWSNNIYYPYRNFYTAGRGVGWKWLDLEL